MAAPFPNEVPAPKPAKRRHTGLIIVAVAIVGLLFCGGLIIYPAMRAARETASSMRCHNHLKQLSVAMLMYNDANGRSYPPAYIADADGKPMHSWRVLILPYLGDPVGNEVYESYRFDEPWNSEHNQSLAAKMPEVFRCANEPEGSGKTHFLAVVGDDTMWPHDQAVTFRDLRDGPSNIISVVEAGVTAVPWLEPRDIAPEEFLNELAEPIHRQGTAVAMADSRVLRLRPDAPAELVQGMITRAGRERIDENEVLGR